LLCSFVAYDIEFQNEANHKCFFFLILSIKNHSQVAFLSNSAARNIKDNIPIGKRNMAWIGLGFSPFLKMQKESGL